MSEFKVTSGMKDIMLVLLSPLILPVLFIAGCLLSGLIILFLMPFYWTQCQVFKYFFNEPFTWSCF